MFVIHGQKVDLYFRIYYFNRVICLNSFNLIGGVRIKIIWTLRYSYAFRRKSVLTAAEAIIKLMALFIINVWNCVINFFSSFFFSFSSFIIHIFFFYKYSLTFHLSYTIFEGVVVFLLFCFYFFFFFIRYIFYSSTNIITC